MSRPTRQWTLADLKAECTEEVGDCWEWQRSMNGGRRQPQINVGGTPQSAHRLAYALHKGLSSIDQLPAGKCVWRTCGNSLCINPAHLRAGTAAERQAALAKAGVYRQSQLQRMQKQQRARQKLTLEDARRIRASTDPVKVTAAREGLSTATVISIRNGHSWREAPASSDPTAALAAVWHVRPSAANDQQDDDQAA